MTHTDKELSGIPDSVTRMVGFYMGQLRDHAAALEGVRRARGNGHTLSLEVADRTEAIKKSFQRLTDIHDVALSNGVGDRFLGLVAGHGMPDFAHHGFPAGEVPDWVKGVVRYAMDEWTKVYPAPTSVPFELRPAGGVFRGMSDFDAAVSYAGEVASFFGEHGVAGDVFVVAGPTSTTKSRFEVVSASAGYPVLHRSPSQLQEAETATTVDRPRG